jgi:hypothetical protein
LLVGKERLVFGWWGKGGEEEDQTAIGFTIAGLSVLVEFVALFVEFCFFTSLVGGIPNPSYGGSADPQTSFRLEEESFLQD